MTEAEAETSLTIYLDHNATTPLSDEVAAVMRKHLHEGNRNFGNPSSAHVFGREAHDVVERARSQVAAMLNAAPSEIVFTGSGSESNNLALIGFAKTRLRRGEEFCAVTSTIEHPAVVEPLRSLEDDFPGRVAVRVVPVDADCRIEIPTFASAMVGAHLASVMLANNETGTIQAVDALSAHAHRNQAVMHVDAAQAVGKIKVDVDNLGADLLTVVGHKIGAPKGVGALYVRDGVPLVPLIVGGGHENGRRAGTENVLLIAALGEACANAQDRMASMTSVALLRDALEHALRDEFGERVVVNGDLHHRLPNTLHVSIRGVVASDILERTPEVAASTGSACHEGGVTLSPVLKAMGVDDERGAGAFRFSLGPENTQSEIERAAKAILRQVRAALSFKRK